MDSVGKDIVDSLLSVALAGVGTYVSEGSIRPIMFGPVGLPVAAVSMLVQGFSEFVVKGVAYSIVEFTPATDGGLWQDGVESVVVGAGTAVPYIIVKLTTKIKQALLGGDMIGEDYQYYVELVRSPGKCFLVGTSAAAAARATTFALKTADIF